MQRQLIIIPSLATDTRGTCGTAGDSDVCQTVETLPTLYDATLPNLLYPRNDGVTFALVATYILPAYNS